MNEITIEAKLNDIKEVGEFIDTQLKKLSGEKILQIQMNISVEEQYINITMVIYRELKK